MAAERLVWLSAWEWECCGAPFRVGEAVEWSRADVDREWLSNLLGHELAGSITDSETHHASERTPLSGEVTHIRAVFATPGERESATFADRQVGDAAEYSTAQARGQTFSGYLVELRAL